MRDATPNRVCDEDSCYLYDRNRFVLNFRLSCRRSDGTKFCSHAYRSDGESRHVRTFEVTMMNGSKSSTADFLIYVAELVQKPNGDYELVSVGEGENSCAKWIKLSSDKASIGPTQALSVKGTLTVPRGASGGRYAAVVFELIPEQETGEVAFASSTFVQRFVTVIELSIPARHVQKRLDVTGFNVTYAGEVPVYSSVYGKQALILSAEVKNEGDIHVFPVEMILRDGAGKRLREIPLVQVEALCCQGLLLASVPFYQAVLRPVTT